MKNVYENISKINQSSDSSSLRFFLEGHSEDFSSDHKDQFLVLDIIAFRKNPFLLISNTKNFIFMIRRKILGCASRKNLTLEDSYRRPIDHSLEIGKISKRKDFMPNHLQKLMLGLGLVKAIVVVQLFG